MITLAKKIKEEREKKQKGANATETSKSSRVSVRDKLLTKGMEILRLIKMYLHIVLKLIPNAT